MKNKLFLYNQKLQLTVIVALFIASFLFFIGVSMHSSLDVFVASLLFLIMIAIIIFKHNNINKFLVLFAIVVVSTTLGLGFELQSNYLIGQDVQGEHFTIESLKLGLIKPGELSLYSDILLFSYNFIVLEIVLGTQLIKIMKFVGAFFISLIPLFVYVYVFKIFRRRMIATIASIAVITQLSFVVTLHSTLKQAFSILIALALLISFYNCTKFLDFSSVLVYTILLIGITGYHYTTSAIITVVLLIAIPVSKLISRFSATREGFSVLHVLLILPIIIWLLWYIVFTKNIAIALSSLLQRIFSIKPAYYYEYQSYSPNVQVEYLRYLVNGIFIIALILGSFSRQLLREFRLNNIHMFKCINIACILSFITNIVTEVTRMTTIGIGRVFIIYLVLLSPVLYQGFKETCLIILNRVKTLRKHSFILIKLFILIVFILKFALTLGVFNYTMNMINNTPFYDDNYNVKNSVTDADIITLSFVEKAIDTKNKEQISIATDLKGLTRLRYFPRLVLSTNIVYSYFSPKVFKYHLFSEESNKYIIYINSYNMMIGKIIATLKLYYKTDVYLPILLKTKNLIFNSSTTILLK